MAFVAARTQNTFLLANKHSGGSLKSFAVLESCCSSSQKNTHAVFGCMSAGKLLLLQERREKQQKIAACLVCPGSTSAEHLIEPTDLPVQVCEGLKPGMKSAFSSLCCLEMQLTAILRLLN